MKATQNSAPVLAIDPYAIEVLQSPYAFQRRLLEVGPVTYIEKYGVFAVGRHAEVADVFSDYKRFTASGGVGIQDIRKPGAFRIPSRLLENDPPKHTQLRAVLSRLLSPIVIRSWRSKFEAEAARVAAQIVERGTFDGVEDVAEAYILKVFPEALGVDLPRENVLAIGEMRFNQSGPPNELYHRAMEQARPYLEWFEKSTQRKNVAPGSISAELFNCEDRGEIEPGVASNMVRTFVGGGTDSTIAGLGHALNFLAQNPDQWRELKANPARAKHAFEEALRLEPPFQVTYRTTTAETELSGIYLPADAKVGLFLGAANRDPRKWTCPDRFDMARDTTGVHLGFGSGAHICIGQMIARLEAEAMLKALAMIVDGLEPAGDLPAHQSDAPTRPAPVACRNELELKRQPDMNRRMGHFPTSVHILRKPVSRLRSIAV